MKFRFSLIKVLQHRKTLEDLAQRDFQEAFADLHFEENILKDMIDSKRVAREKAYKTQVQGGSAGQNLTQVYEFLVGQDIRIERQMQKIEEKKRKVEELRDILRQKATDRKIVEGLRDKKKHEFKKKQDKLEQKNQDDLTTMRFKRHE